MREFVKKHGRLPRHTAGSGHPFLPGEKELANWASRQRQYYKGRKQPELSAEQVAALEAVPGWYWAAYEVQPWDQRLRQVLDFVLQHGRLPRHAARSGHPFLPDEKELGLWASRQRDCYKGRRQPQLSTEQAAALETVPGWYWAAFEIQPWDQWHQQVAHFVRQHERLPRYYPSSQAPLLSGEKELGAWCNRQQQRVKGPRHIGAPLTPGQQAALQALPGWFWQGSPGRSRNSNVAF